MVEYEVLGTIKNRVIIGTEIFLEFEERVIRFKDISVYSDKVVFVDCGKMLKKTVNKIFGDTVKECFFRENIENLDLDKICEHYIKCERDFNFWCGKYSDTDLRSLEIYGYNIALILSNDRVIEIQFCRDGGCDIYLLKE